MSSRSVEESVRRYFDSQAGRYGSGDSGTRLLQRRIRQAALDELRGAPGPLVELGCGNGLFLGPLQAAGHHPVIGADFSYQMLQNAKKACRSLVLARAQDLPLGTGSAGAAVCINVILNLPEREMFEGLLAEASRILQPGGRLVFEFRNGLNPLNLLVFTLKRTLDHPLWTYRMAEVREHVRRVHLDVKKVRPILAPITAFAPALVVVAEKPRPSPR